MLLSKRYFLIMMDAVAFHPIFQMTSIIIESLIRVEELKEKVVRLPLNVQVISSLREAAKLNTTYYSTMIEGNQLNPEEVKEVVEDQERSLGREREEREVKGYYAALKQLEQYVEEDHPLTEKVIKQLHALVMSD